MLALDSPRWTELDHAYGSAADIPALLRQLDALPESHGNDEPWHSLWSALAHQGDVYSASFAAVPHVIAAMARDPLRASDSFLHFPAWVEICRQKTGVPIPTDLQGAYSEALRRLPGLIAAASAREWNADFTRCALAALAACKGNVSVAEATLELTPEVADEFLEWFFER